MMRATITAAKCGESRRWLSRKELPLDLLLRNQLAGFGLREPLFDLRKEAEALNRVLERGIVRKATKSLDGGLLCGSSGHGRRLAMTESVAAGGDGDISRVVVFVTHR